MLIGTIEYHVLGKVIAAPHTTPESLELNRMFAEALEDGATETVMEVSSHALEQQRVYGIPYDVAVFTNLTRDHLDYHETIEEYFESKKMLFEGVGTDPPQAAVINIDDEYGRELVKFSKKDSEVVTYGLAQGDFHAKNVDIGLKGRVSIWSDRSVPIWSPLIGRVNVYNIMAASAAAWARGSAKTDHRGSCRAAECAGKIPACDCGTAIHRSRRLCAYGRRVEESDGAGAGVCFEAAR